MKPINRPSVEFSQVLDIVRQEFVARRYAAYFTPGDFCHRWHAEVDPSSPPIARIWGGPDGRASSFAWLSGGQAHIIIGCAGRADIENEMLTWVEETQAKISESGHALGRTRMSVVALEEDLARQAILRQRDYEATDRALVLRWRELDDLPPALAPPPGYALRYVSDGVDIERWIAAYRLAFAPERMTANQQRNVTRSPLYRRDLDLMVVARDGSVAAFATLWLDAATRTGTFEPVGCVPAHQRKGLARLLIYTGLRQLRQLGAATAFVSTAAHRMAANRLYEAAGFRTLARSRHWQLG